MDPAASAEACKAAESATNIALVRSCTSVAVLLSDVYSYLPLCLCWDRIAAPQLDCRLSRGMTPESAQM